MKLVWSKAALHDLFEIAEYIAQDSEQNAAFVEARIHETAKLISAYPQSGRIGRVPVRANASRLELLTFWRTEFCPDECESCASSTAPAVGPPASISI